MSVAIKIFPAQFPGPCALCPDPIKKDQMVGYVGSMLVHYLCATRGEKRTLTNSEEVSRAASLADVIGSEKAADFANLVKVGLTEGWEPYEFQYAGIYYVEQHDGRALIADDMGLGKTIQFIGYLALHPELRPCVIVCPASLQINWWRELRARLKHLKQNKVIMLRGTVVPLRKNRIYIVSYDSVSKWLDEFAKIDIKVIGLDEVHSIKSQTTKRTKAIVGTGTKAKKKVVLDDGGPSELEDTKFLVKNVPHVIAMSGTPFLNRPKELWTTIHCLRPDIWSNWWQFVTQYCGGKKTNWGLKTSGSTKTAELAAKLRSSCMIRREKKQVLKDLPAKTRTTIPLSITNRKTYKFAEKNLIAYLKDIGSSPEEITSAERAEVLVRIEKLKQLVVAGKYDQIKKRIEDFLDDSEEKLVVSVHHRFLAEWLIRDFAKYGLVTITGSDNNEARDAAVQSFQNSPSTRLLIGSLRAAGQGLTLTAASNMFMLELDWTAAIHDQMEDRIHRIGQHWPVNIWYLLGTKTIEQRIATIIEGKRAQFKAVMDDEVSGEQDSILTALLGSYYDEDEDDEDAA